MTRSQDLRIIQAKFKQPTVLKQETLAGQELTTFADVMQDLVTKDDDYYAAFKNNRHTNYKKG
jgi:hypothetical protein